MSFFHRIGYTLAKCPRLQGRATPSPESRARFYTENRYIFAGAWVYSKLRDRDKHGDRSNHREDKSLGSVHSRALELRINKRKETSESRLITLQRQWFQTRAFDALCINDHRRNFEASFAIFELFVYFASYPCRREQCFRFYDALVKTNVFSRGFGIIEFRIILLLRFESLHKKNF